MLVPGFIISAITFPGVVVHELGHKKFAELTGVKVREICLFRFGNPAGYVIHEPTTNFKQSFFITAGPFIVGTLLSLLIFSLTNFFDDTSLLGKIIVWLGISVAMNSFPSSTDAKSLWKDTNNYIKNNKLALAGYPISLVIFISNILSFIWFDLIYAVLLYSLVSYKF